MKIHWLYIWPVVTFYFGLFGRICLTKMGERFKRQRRHQDRELYPGGLQSSRLTGTPLLKDWKGR